MSVMEFLVECLLCKEIIKCQPNDTIRLVNHVKLKHPDIKVSNLPYEFSTLQKSASDKKTKKLRKVTIAKSELSSCEYPKITGRHLQQIMEENKLLAESDGKPDSKEDKTENNEKKQEGEPIKPIKPIAKSRKLYKTSVEKWKPGDDKIICPKCESVVRPMIRTSADRVSHNPVGAAFIMACWPFCFFPFLFPAPIQEHLHCSICGYYFGTYDHEKQQMSVGKEPIKAN